MLASALQMYAKCLPSTCQVLANGLAVRHPNLAEVHLTKLGGLRLQRYEKYLILVPALSLKHRDLSVIFSLGGNALFGECQGSHRGLLIRQREHDAVKRAGVCIYRTFVYLYLGEQL